MHTSYEFILNTMWFQVLNGTLEYNRKAESSLEYFNFAWRCIEPDFDNNIVGELNCSFSSLKNDKIEQKE